MRSNPPVGGRRRLRATSIGEPASTRLSRGNGAHCAPYPLPYHSVGDTAALGGPLPQVNAQLVTHAELAQQ